MDKAKVLLVGIGGYGENYIKEFFERDIERAELVGVADPFIDKSSYKDEIVKRNIPIYSSPEAFFLSGGKADLTVISSPIHTHYDYIMTALKSGSNVLVEKPVSISMERMNELIKAEEESGLFVAVGYQLCFARDVLSLKNRVLSGEFGKPVRMKGLRLMRRGDKYYSRTGWAGKLSCHGEYVFDSPVSNACAHQIQVMLFFLGHDMESTGSVGSVDGVLYKARRDIENYDAAALDIHTDENVDIFYYTAHSLDEKKVGPYLELEFEKATIKSENDNFEIVYKDSRVEDLSSQEKGERLQKLYDSIESALDGTRPAVTLKTSLAHIKCVLEAEKLPVYLRYDAVKKKSEDGDEYWAIEGLKNLYLNCYENWTLPEIQK